jgi:hypothetical protein
MEKISRRRCKMSEYCALPHAVEVEITVKTAREAVQNSVGFANR